MRILSKDDLVNLPCQNNDPIIGSIEQDIDIINESFGKMGEDTNVIYVVETEDDLNEVAVALDKVNLLNYDGDKDELIKNNNLKSIIDTAIPEYVDTKISPNHIKMLFVVSDYGDGIIVAISNKVADNNGQIQNLIKKYAD